MPGKQIVTPPENAAHDNVTRQVLLRKLLTHSKQICHEQLHRILQTMFDGADDTLFKMAENAEEHGDTNPYFDSMRVVRIQRESIEKRFFQAMDESFAEFQNRDDNDSHKPDLTSVNYDNLELVSEDDLEMRLATQHLSQKIQSQYAQDLYTINQRLTYLRGTDEIEHNSIPFGAQPLVEAYATATTNNDFMQEVRIILLKLFDWSCIQGLSELYAQINQAFIDAGVLPVIKTTVRKQDRNSSAPSGASPIFTANTAYTEQAPLPAGGNNLWDTLQAYLHQHHVEINTPPPHGYEPPSGNHEISLLPTSVSLQGSLSGVPPVKPFSTQDLIGPLTTLQLDEEGMLPANGAHAIGNYVRVQLQADDNSDNQNMRQLSPVDNDLIDVVCLIFEYILDDPELAHSAKACLRRLQIPMLKVALLDKQFFSMHGHPARDLLNQLARAAIGIDEEDEDDPVLTKINDIVQHIIEDFTDDMAIFSELVQEFESFMQSQQNQATDTLNDIERRQQGREEMALARAWVRETLEQHLLGRSLPAVVVDIILGAWKDVMLQTYLQEGEDSLLWKTQIRFIDVLCWSVQPKQVVLDKNKLGNIIRQLIHTLRDGLGQIDYPQEEVEAIFTALEPYHLASVRGETSMPTQPPANTLSQAIATTENEYAKLLEPSTNTESLEELNDDKVILEDIVLEGWESDPMLDAINDEYLELARHLEMGKWVEFQNDTGERRHAKLAWKSELLGEYTFLNWKFDVVADKSLLELAEDLRHGKARVVDDVPLMDRALSSVLTTLIPKPK